MATPSRKPATHDALIARGDTDRLELAGREIVEKAPSPAHSLVEAKLAVAFDPCNRRLGGKGGPGGWWLFTEIPVGYPNGEIYCHDAASNGGREWREQRSVHAHAGERDQHAMVDRR